MKEPNPLVVAAADWADSIPDWLRHEIEVERMAEALSDLPSSGGGREEVGDAECVAYLMTASLSMPMPGDWARIYQQLCTRLMKKARDVDVPEDIAVHQLSEHEESLLKDLRRQLYRKRGGRVRNELTDATEEVFLGKGRSKRTDKRRPRPMR